MFKEHRYTQDICSIQNLEYWYTQQQHNKFFDEAYKVSEKMWKHFFEYQDKCYEAIKLTQKYKKDFERLKKKIANTGKYFKL